MADIKRDEKLVKGSKLSGDDYQFDNDPNTDQPDNDEALAGRPGGITPGTAERKILERESALRPALAQDEPSLSLTSSLIRHLAAVFTTPLQALGLMRQ